MVTTQTKREELLQLDGIGRNQLERRIVRLVHLYDAAMAVVEAEDGPLAGHSERVATTIGHLRATLKQL